MEKIAYFPKKKKTKSFKKQTNKQTNIGESCLPSGQMGVSRFVSLGRVKETRN